MALCQAALQEAELAVQAHMSEVKYPSSFPLRVWLLQVEQQRQATGELATIVRDKQQVCLSRSLVLALFC